MVQVVTGNSQEEVIIFRDTQTDRTFLLYIDDDDRDNEDGDQ